MLEACKQSTKCERFIPSEWTLNVEEYPEQPMFLAEANKALHEKLKEVKDVESTIICNGWFADYVLPQHQRHMKSIGAAWPMDRSTKIFTIYGPGTQPVDVTSARDVAKTVAILLDSEQPWEPDIYMSGSQLTWNDLFALIKGSDPDWTSKTKPLADTVLQIAQNESPENVFIAHFEIQSYSGALAFSQEKVQRHRAKYFKGLKFRTVRDMLDISAEHPDQIV